MTTATAQKTDTYVVRIDLSGKPFVRQYAEGTTAEEALAAAQEHCSDGEVAAEAVPLQPILDAIIEKREAGGNFSVSFKHEDEDEETFVPFGPVWITDLDGMRAEAERQGAIRDNGAIVLEVPFDHAPDYETPLPWMSKANAARLADYLGVSFGEA